jgi:carbonic anhydrase
MIDSIWKNLPKQKEKQVLVADTTVDASALVPKDHSYYTFQGSLTTPPCSEDVRWLVLKAPMKVSDGEIATFAGIYPMNARPTQPLNGRLVQVSK